MADEDNKYVIINSNIFEEFPGSSWNVECVMQQNVHSASDSDGLFNVHPTRYTCALFICTHDTIIIIINSVIHCLCHRGYKQIDEPDVCLYDTSNNFERRPHGYIIHNDIKQTGSSV